MSSCPLCEEELSPSEIAEMAAESAPAFTADEAMAIVERINDDEWGDFIEAVNALAEARQ